ncbi:3984_t:CDS:1, partial [Paraglomus occultum]
MNGQDIFAHVRSIIEMEKEFCLKVDELLTYLQIPGHLHSSRQAVNQNKLLSLVEDFSFVYAVKKGDVIGKVNVWLYDNPAPAKYDFIVMEILYHLNNTWK